jgi:hypothetical protein
MKVMSYFGCRQSMVPNHAICERETEGKTCKQNREGYIYTEKERERREIKRDWKIETEGVHINTYMNA